MPKLMSEDEIKRLLEPEEDVLRPSVEMASHSLRECPSCGCAVAARFSLETKRVVQECTGCGFTVDAESGLVIALGNPSKTRDVVVRMVTPPGER